MKRPILLAMCVWVSACSSLSGEDYGLYDENESFNRASYKLSDDVDRAVLVPVARGYQKVMPNAVEQGVTNVFQNLRTVASSANGFLQGKPKARGGRSRPLSSKFHTRRCWHI